MTAFCPSLSKILSALHGAGRPGTRMGAFHGQNALGWVPGTGMAGIKAGLSECHVQIRHQIHVSGSGKMATVTVDCTQQSVISV